METCRQTPASKKTQLLPKVSDVLVSLSKLYIVTLFFIFCGSNLSYFYLNGSFLRRGLPDREIC